MSQILKALKQLQSETDGQGAPPTSDPPPQPAPVEAIAPVPVEAPPPAAEPSAVSEPIAKPEFIASGGALATTVVERLADARWRRQLDMLADALLAELPLAPPVTVMLTGVDAGDHSGETAAALATLLTHRRHNVLLVDANLAGRVVSQGFDVPQRAGLTDLLTSVNAVAGAVCGTDNERLALLPRGKTTPTVGSVEQFPTRMAELRRQFDFVILDGGDASAPLTHRMARCCDAVYLVLRLGRTDATSAGATCRRLHSAGARLLGTIVTNAPYAA